MKKLRLDPDTLRVDSFSPAHPQEGEGTVVARQITAGGCFSGTLPSCRPTCYDTCGNVTCAYTCPYTCEPLICG